MTKNKKWKVCYNVDLQFYYPARSARYVQIGIVTKGYFTGYIHDYAGGGRWLRTWFLNGHRFELEDDDSRYDYVRKIARREIERVYPGLCTEINAILRRYVYWRDEVPYGTTLACNEELNCPAEEMIANGDMFPMNIGNTMFPHAMPELDCFVITSRGKVLTKREYERSEWENYPRRCYQPYPGTLYGTSEESLITPQP